MLGCRNEGQVPNSGENNINQSSSKLKTDELFLDTFFLLKREFKDRPKYFHHVYESKDLRKYKTLESRLKQKDISLVQKPKISSNPSSNLGKLDLFDLPRMWTEVVYHSQKFYLKYPSDFCYLDQRVVSNTSLIKYTCEGPFSETLRTVNKIDKVRYEVIVGNDLFNKERYQITIIDTISDIAIWRDSKGYKFFANVDKFRNTPIAVADCNSNKCQFEIESENIDYIELEKNAK